MLVLRFACIVALLLPGLYTRAQERPPGALPPSRDSLKANLEYQMRNTMSDMEKNIFSIGKTPFFKGRIDAAINQVNQLSLFQNKLGFSPKGLLKKNFLENTSGGVEYSNRIFRQGPDDMQVFDKLVVNAGVTVAKIPLDLDFMRIDEKVQFDHSLHNLNANFSREEFINRLKSKLKEKFNPENLLKQYDQQIAALKNSASSGLKQELKNIGEKYKDLPGIPAGLLEGNWDSDLSGLMSRTLNPQLTQQVNEKKELLRQMRSRLKQGKAVDTAAVNRMSREIDQHQGITEMLEKAMEYKRNWESNALVKKIKEVKLLEKETYDKLFSDPASIKKYAAQYLPLSGLEKLFLDINKLSIGQNPVSLGPLSLQNHLSKGVNMEMNRNNKYFMMLSGRQQDPGALHNFSYADAYNYAANQVNGLRFGVGSMNASYAHVSFFTYQAMNNGVGDMSDYNPALQRTSFVATLSNRLDLGEGKYLEAELSRSAMQFSNTDPESGDNKSGVGNLVNGNGIDDIAFMVRYHGAAPQAGLQYDIKLGSVGNGYNNPGSQFLPSGQKELGLSVKKHFLKRKLQVAVRSQFREYKFSRELDNKWTHANYSIEGKWNLKKGESISLRYQPVISTRKEDGMKYTAGKMERLSVQGNFNRKLFGNYYRNTIILAYLGNNYPGVGRELTRNVSLQVNMFQNLAIGENLYYWNINYQHAKNDNELVFMNSAFTTDLGITYNLFKGINCSSGICYNEVSGWYTQAGIRQSINGSIGKKLELSLYVDGKMNIKEYSPLYYTDLLQANVFIRYLLK
jgi:hypothetical protein